MRDQRCGIVIRGDKKKSAEELDNRVPWADWRAAVATASAEENPAYDGYVVVGANCRAAAGTRRPRLHYRKLSWNAVNHYVEKTAEYQSEKKSEDGEEAAGKSVDHAGLGLARL